MGEQEYGYWDRAPEIIKSQHTMLALVTIYLIEKDSFNIDSEIAPVFHIPFDLKVV